MMGQCAIFYGATLRTLRVGACPPVGLATSSGVTSAPSLTRTIRCTPLVQNINGVTPLHA